MALTSAALRGLDVRVIVPARSDSIIVSAAARSYFDELLAAGVRVFEYQPRMLHTKALLIDFVEGGFLQAAFEQGLEPADTVEQFADVGTIDGDP